MVEVESITRRGNDLQGIEEQHMVIERVVLAEVPQMIQRGEIVDFSRRTT